MAARTESLHLRNGAWKRGRFVNFGFVKVCAIRSITNGSEKEASLPFKIRPMTCCDSPDRQFFKYFLTRLSAVFTDLGKRVELESKRDP